MGDYEQLNIFSFLQEKCKAFAPGDWVEKNVLGKQLTFDEIAQEIGNLIIMDKSTESHEWYKVVRVEEIAIVDDFFHDRQRRLVYYDGVKQRGMVCEMFFDENRRFPARAYKIST